MAPRMRPAGTPMAASTWDGVTLPDEQAAPDDTATPSRSSAITAVSAFTPEAANRVVLGSRLTSSPKMTACGAAALSPDFEPVAKRRHPGGLIAPTAACSHRGRAETGDAGHVLGAGTRAALLPATLHLGVKIERIALDQRAGALRPADLVRGQRHQVGTERLEIAGNPAWPLHRIDMQKAARRMNEFGRLRHRLNDAGLVVGEHDRNQRPRRACETALERIEIDHAHRP